ncbi:glycosyl transferase family 2 [Coriobacterium glomerans PW2]|uniref:Glycosyl transferase family 2 n=1 Tax=Coriobacterium glomerans (strain ATCC 49209 / DSM 20642 / JCM 10262 / PW2) TaxID=700015 RepID=F2N836_CORGP|nr:glycosyltransferase family 2 protein [Coriobacterium glomerans]AEB07219.1 glycosyl transferase family 2 [Coriobacterium glomerans PW2]
MKKNIAVLIPCFNEELTIGDVIEDFRRELPDAEIYVYDNASTDRSGAIAREHGAHVRFVSRRGKGNVVRQMIRDIDAECYLMVDGDSTYPAEAGRGLCAPILDGRADMVVGDRLDNGSYMEEHPRVFHRFGNYLVRGLIRFLFRGDPGDAMSGYRALSRPLAKTFPVLADGFQIETELSIHAIAMGWRVAALPIDYRDRPPGSTSKLSTISDGARIIWCVLSMLRAIRPLMFFSVVAVALAAVGGGLASGASARIGEVREVWPPVIPLAGALILLACFALIGGVILDSIAKSERRHWELEVYREMERPLAPTSTEAIGRTEPAQALRRTGPPRLLRPISEAAAQQGFIRPLP